MQQGRQQTAVAETFFGSLALDHAASGVGGAVASTAAFHPLDLVKIRLQVDTASHKEATMGRAVRAARHVVSTDGITGLYRGLGANLAGNSASWGLYFAWYTWIKDQMAGGRAAETASGVSTLSAGQHLVAGAAAGALTQCIANPLWVVKTRVCTTSRGEAGAYRGLIDGLARLAAQEGLRGLYKGLAPGLLGVAHGGLQFMAYEEMKKRRAHGRRTDGFTSAEYAVMSSSSKVFALAITYPSQVLRSRLQQTPGQTGTGAGGAPRMTAYSGLGDALAKTMRAEGVAGFYKGFGPALLRVLPGNIITFIVYEKIAGMLRKQATCGSG
ncbi:mitochondrial FAD carrier protein flx1 [Coemansia guatemalensis]|uniref:Mitochondrial FAD carrier protein flx1 n=1 Tax=Coemansia guatemalensis TaxID=2761395 RepID=A0A9W8HT36_9FUNG|nr:mitochondrial FAD carrier protein flx1 [Coemansia guatemalensis]